MALRLRPNLNTQIQQGFTLIINRDNASYDLDELLANVNRTNADAPLLIQVVNNEIERDKLEEAYIELGQQIERIIGPQLNEGEVTSKINEIISSTLDDFNYTISDENDINTRYFLEVISKYISDKISEYINSLEIFDEDNTPLQGKITSRLSFLIDDNHKINVKVEYDLDDNVKSDKLYEIYQRIYENNSSVDSELQVGGLAIDANKSEKVKITTEDYQKYLLSEEKSTEGYTEPGLRRPLIIWTDATDDPNPDMGGDPLSLLDQIDYLKSVIKELSERDKFEELPEPPSAVGEYILQIKVTSRSTEKSWIRKEELGTAGIIVEENLDGTYTAFVGNSSLERLDNGTLNLILPGVNPTFLDNATYAYIG